MIDVRIRECCSYAEIGREIGSGRSAISREVNAGGDR